MLKKLLINTAIVTASVFSLHSVSYAASDTNPLSSYQPYQQDFSSPRTFQTKSKFYVGAKGVRTIFKFKPITSSDYWSNFESPIKNLASSEYFKIGDEILDQRNELAKSTETVNDDRALVKNDEVIIELYNNQPIKAQLVFDAIAARDGSVAEYKPEFNSIKGYAGYNITDVFSIQAGYTKSLRQAGNADSATVRNLASVFSFAAEEARIYGENDASYFPPDSNHKASSLQSAQEVNANNYAAASPITTEEDYQVWDLSFLVHYPLGLQFNLYGVVGVEYLKYRAKYTNLYSEDIDAAEKEALNTYLTNVYDEVSLEGYNILSGLNYKAGIGFSFSVNNRVSVNAEYNYIFAKGFELMDNYYTLAGGISIAF